VPSTPAGTYPGATSCSGAAAANYAISYLNGTLTVNKAPLTVTGDDKTKVYGKTNPALTATITGFVNHDPGTVVTGTPTVATTATTASGVGVYAITVTPGTLAAANYYFVFQPATLTVTPAPLSVTADDKTKVYYQSNPALTYTITGFVLNDTAASAVTGTPALAPPPPKPLTPGPTRSPSPRGPWSRPTTPSGSPPEP
jgi:type IV secretory pathway VirJ component